MRLLQEIPLLAQRLPIALGLLPDIRLFPIADQGCVSEALQIRIATDEISLQLDHDEGTLLVKREEVDLVFPPIEAHLSADDQQLLAEHVRPPADPSLYLALVDRLLGGGRLLDLKDRVLFDPEEHPLTL